MATSEPGSARVAGPAEVEQIGQLLHDFNTEFEEPTPGAPALAERVEQLMRGGDTVVLLAGQGPDGVAVLRFRVAIWSRGFECYLAELYVRKERRGRGVGRALMEEALRVARERGADTMDLGTDGTDGVAHRLYESLGFSKLAHGDHGPTMYVYEREL